MNGVTGYTSHPPRYPGPAFDFVPFLDAILAAAPTRVFAVSFAPAPVFPLPSFRVAVHSRRALGCWHKRKFPVVAGHNQMCDQTDFPRFA